MLFAWIGFIKDGAETIPQDVQQQTNDFLQQPYIPIHSVGPLYDENDRRAAMLMIFEAEDRATAEALVTNSPYMRAGIYDRYQLYEYRNEVG
jgi:uncharacterized protein YciI